LQEFLTNMPWDEEDLNRQRVQKMIAEATTGHGVLVVDDTGFPKQGKASVGVKRQYSGTLGKRALQGEPEERKYYWSNLPADTTLAELAGYAHRRHAIEQFHEEAKGELGWDQYRVRLWPGFHRHAIAVMPAYSFMVWLELRQRCRQPRRAPATLFPPRSDRRRRTLPAVHREVGQWLRHQAVLWWVTTDRFIELCSRRF
jgi:SRSO17 transposase